MSAPLMVQPRCPVCWAPTEGWRCGLGCDIERCPEEGCGELREVGKPHECSATCTECGDRFKVPEGCTGHLDGDFCGSCFALACRECKAEAYDDRGVGSAIESWRDR